MSSRTALAPGNDRNSDTVSGARPLGERRSGSAAEPLVLVCPSPHEPLPSSPGPGPACHLPTPVRTSRPLDPPPLQLSPTPGDAPLSGPLSCPSADRFRSGLFPPGSPLLCLPGAPPFSGVFLSPFPSWPPASNNSPPPGFAGLLTPRPGPGSLPGRPGPVPPLAPAFPIWMWVPGSPGAPLFSFSALRPSGSSRILWAPPHRKPVSTFSWAQGPF